MENLIKKLNLLKDDTFAEFTRKLIPNIDPGSIIGVKTPELKKIAKELIKNNSYNELLRDLPHAYFEENQLHAFIISEIKNFDECIKELELFLPFINNWATCDQLLPKIFSKNKEKLLPYTNKWINSNHEYTIRFGIGMLMKHFLDENFKTEYIEKVISIKSDKYYVNMEIAWFLATALTKKWDETIIYIESKKLNKWIQNKTIQKARESYRILPERKEYLKSLKI